QAMAEFMKERARVVDAQQAGLSVAALGEVHHIDDDRQLRAIELLLPAETAHPGAAALRRPGEIIAQKQRFWRAVTPPHFPCANVGMIELEVEALGEGQPEQAACGVKSRVDDAVNLQVWLELALVQVELGLASLFREIAPVPGRKFEVAAFARH